MHAVQKGQTLMGAPVSNFQAQPPMVWLMNPLDVQYPSAC
jgi:hypothetical protein